MSTRAVIARQTGEHTFSGRYHHWDGYPSGLGATLFKLAQPDGPFEGDVPRMLKVLLDEHPAGWSTINAADFSKEPGFRENDCNDGTKGPMCYCHGTRSEKEHVVTEKDASAIGCEWAYVFTEDRRMLVLSSYCPDGVKMIGAFGCGDPEATWQVVAEVNLAGAEPEWALIGG